MREALARARSLYREALASTAGAPARAYLAERGVREESVEAFALGWAPAEPGWLCSRLRRLGIPEEALVGAGLAMPPEGGGGLRDRFWDRLMFPVADPGGRTVGFGGRLLPGSRGEERGLGKYVNSPEGPLFPKRRLLYGLDRLQAALRDQPEAPIYLCEGFLDVVMLHQAGWTTAVAALGTAITAEHGRRLRRLERPVALVLDPDRAGREAAFRAARVLVAEGVDVRVVELPDGADPADLVAAGRLEELAQRLRAMRDILQWRLEAWLRREDLGVPAVQARAAREMADWVAAAADPVVAELWMRRACDVLGLSEDSLRRLLRRPASGPPGSTAPAAPSTPAPAAGTSARELLVRNERELLAALLRDPSLWIRHRAELESLQCTDSATEKVLNWCRERRKHGQPFDLGLALEAFADDAAMELLDAIRVLPIADPERALEGALRTLPQNRELLRREERRRRPGPPSDEDLARWQRRVSLSPRPRPGEPSP